jgi:tetratricopeptide (TPR) repeat protein
MTDRGLRPNINPADSPPYHELSEVVFEELCCAIHAQDSDISTCERFGVRGQGQFGIDLLAWRRQNDGIEVGQCKCYKNFAPASIKQASDTFLKYWDARWKERDVRRFILFVACDLSKTDRQDQLERERERFAALGVIYEAWSARVITHKLRSAPAVVARYIGEYWFEKIVGMKMPTFTMVMDSTGGGAQRDAASALMEKQIELLRPRVTAGVARDLDEIRALSRQGRDREALARLDLLDSNHAIWALLDDRARARALRLRAGIMLRGEYSLADTKRLAEEAERLDSAGAVRLKALIADREQGPAAALAVLGDATSEELAQVRSVCLLRLDRMPEALACLESFSEDGPDAAETRRLRGLTRALMGDREGAEREARDAARLAPGERLVRHTLAIVLYSRALSPAVPFRSLMPRPDPVDWTLVRRDDEAVAKLAEAEAIFASLLELELPAAEREDIEGWRLACLADDPSRRAETEAYCGEILKADAANAAAVAWALARNLPFKSGASRKALRDLIAGGRGEIRHVLAFAALLFSAKQYKKSLELLDRQREQFVKHGGEDLWRLWYAQAETMASAGRNKAPRAGANMEGHLAALDAAIDPDAKRGDGRLAELAMTNGKPGGNALVLLNSVERLAQRGRWIDVAPHAGTLVDTIGTADAVRLAIYALSATGNDAAALKFLTERESVFPGGSLPGDLRRLRIRCRVNVGQVPEAIIEAEEIARGPAGAADIIDLAELYLIKGDPRRASDVVRNFNKRQEIPPQEALRLSRQLLLDDPGLALELWRQAVAAGLDDKLVTVAYEIGERLSVGREIGPVASRMNKLVSGGTSGVVALSFDEVLAFLQKRRQQADYLEGIYRSGKAPIHMIAGPLNLPLARLYHTDLEERCEDGTWSGGFLLARHGGRRLPDDYPKTPSELKLHLDVTAVLLAEHLHILDAVEKCFRPLRIPLDLMPALLAMRDAVAPIQPARIQARREIVRLSQEQRFVVVEPPPSDGPRRPEITAPEALWLAERAKQDGGTVVDFNDPDPTVAQSQAERFSNCRGLLDALRAAGPLSTGQYDTALGSLGTEGHRPPRVAPIWPGAPVYFHGATADVFAMAGVLDVACERFSVRVERSELEMARAEIAGSDRANRLIAWLTVLIARIQQGIDSGSYVHLPRSSRRETGEIDARGDHDLLGLLDLLSIKVEQGDVVWFDDRALTSYSNVNGAAIVGVNEILKGLLIYAAITAERYHECLVKLRAAHVRYIPLEDGELIRHLRSAPIRSGVVLETRELGIIRRYIAACFVQDDILQLPPMPDDAHTKDGEIWFAIRLQRAIHEGILDVWRDEDANTESRAARADWIRDNLEIQWFQRLPAPNRQERDRRDVLAAHLASLIAQSIQLGRPFRTAEDDRMAKYMDWLDASVVQPRLDADADLLNVVAERLIALLIVDRRSPSDQEEVRQAWKLIVRTVINAMPETVREAMFKDARVVEMLGVRVDALVGVGDRQFPESQFWAACATAIALGVATIKATDGQEQTIRPEVPLSAAPVLLFERQEAPAYRLADPINVLLLADSHVWLQALRESRHWLDMSEEKREQSIVEIGRLADPAKRIAAVAKLRQRSIANHYRALAGRVLGRDSTIVNDLRPPSAGELLRHCRLIGGDTRPFRERLDDAARVLVTQEGADEAYVRLAGLPVSMPESVFATLDALSADECRAVFDRWYASSRSPVSRFHLLRAAMRIRVKYAAAVDIAQLLEDILADVQHGGEVDAFLAILRRVELWFREILDERTQSASDLSVTDRLALTWSHANRVFQILRAGAVPLDWIIGTFGEVHDGGDDLSFHAPAFAYCDDVSLPQEVGRGLLIVQGLWYGLGEDAVDRLGAERVARLRALAVQNIEGTPMPVLEFLRDPELAGNLLGSFLAGGRPESFAALFGQEIAEWYKHDTLQNLAKASVDKAVAANSRAHDWLYLDAVVHRRNPYAEIKSDLEGALTRTDFAALHHDDNAFGMYVLRFAVHQAARSGNRETVVALSDSLVRIADGIHQREPLSAPASFEDWRKEPFREMFFLLEFAYVLSRSEADATQNAAHFATLSRRLVKAWPGSASIVRHVLTRFAMGASFSLASSLWPVLVEVRAM